MSADSTANDEAPDAPLDVAVEVETPPPPAPSAEERIAKLEQEKKDSYDRFLRAAADLENQRKRSKRDLDDARAEAKTRVLKEMLPVVDNLERALQHADEAVKKSQSGEPADVGAIVDGVRLVLRQFAHAFERVDVTPVEADGQPFDPNVHEAISQAETADKPPGTVVSVLQKGYKLGDRLLRPALVVVAKPASSAAADGGRGSGSDGGGGEGA